MAACRAVRRSIGGLPPGAGSDSVELAALDGNQMGGTGGTPEQVYESAYDQYMNRQFGEAEAGFRLFLFGVIATNELAGNAQYSLGETYFVQGKYKEAARSFLTGFQTYPKSPRGAECASQARHVARQARPEGAGLRRLRRGAEADPAAAEARNQALRELKRAGC